MKIQFAVVKDGEITLRGKREALPVMRKFAAKFGGKVISLDSKQAVWEVTQSRYTKQFVNHLKKVIV